MRQILFLIFVIILTFSSCSQTQKKQTHHPNVVVILADDQGWGDLSINGNTSLQTPNIDQLATNGTSFDNFFVSAVCSPTRAEFLTGRYAVRGGVYSTSQGGERLDLDEETIADAFKANGYRTAAFGKWHNGMQYPYHPNARGFDEFYGYCSGHWGNYINPMIEHNGKLTKATGYLTNDLTSRAINFISENKKTPFFVYLPLNTPHSPMQVPDSMWKKFKKKPLLLHRFSDKEKPNKTRAALAMVENIDYNVGRVMQKLRELQLEENTIVLYFSDNGPNGYRYNGGMKGIKGQVDEGGVKSPLFIQWKKKIKAGKKIESIASAMDLFPTLISLAQLNFQPKKQIDGKNLLAHLTQNKPVSENRHIINYWKGKVSVRNQQFRLDEHNQLFDMKNDPQQLVDVAPLYPTVFAEMKDQKKNWKQTTLAELPDSDKRTFPIGHPDWEYNQLPARDAQCFGNIKRSSKWPNCSYFTNWISTSDSITWDVDVLENGNFEATLLYTCSAQDIGSTIELSSGKNKISNILSEAHNPPILYADKDRFPREESYTKQFKPLVIGTIYLTKGTTKIKLKATSVKAGSVADVRLVLLRRTK